MSVTLTRNEKFERAWAMLKEARAARTKGEEYSEYIDLHGLLRACGMSRAESLKVVRSGLQLDILARAGALEHDSDSEADEEEKAAMQAMVASEPAPFRSSKVPATATLPSSSLLARLTVSEIAETQERVFVLSGDMATEEAVATLLARELKQAPVYDAGASAFLGFFRVCDVAHLVVRLAESEGAAGLDGVTLGELLDHRDRCKLRTVVNPTRNPFVGVTTADPITVLAQHVIEGARQAVVFEAASAERRHPIQVLTEGMLTEFLEARIDEVPEVSERLVGSVQKWRAMDVVSVTDEETLLDALQAMARSRHSAVPVLDASGCLRSCLRIEDISIPIQLQDFSTLFLDVAELDERCRAAGLPSCMRDAATVEPQHTVLDALQRMRALRTHQLYMADTEQGGRIVGVVSLRDILNLLVNTEAPMVDPDA